MGRPSLLQMTVALGLLIGSIPARVAVLAARPRNAEPVVGSCARACVVRVVVKGRIKARARSGVGCRHLLECDQSGVLQSGHFIRGQSQSGDLTATLRRATARATILGRQTRAVRQVINQPPLPSVSESRSVG